MTLADKIVLLNAGEAVLQEGTSPKSVHTAGAVPSSAESVRRRLHRFAKMNFLPGRLTRIEPTGVTITLPDGSTARALVDASAAQPGDMVTLGIRPEHVMLRCQCRQHGSSRGRPCRASGRVILSHTQVQGVENHVVVRQEGDTAARMGDRL